MPVHIGSPFLALVLACPAFVACGDSGVDLGPSEDLVITRITQPGFSGYDASQRLVIRTQAAWQDVWQMLWRRSSDVPALPAVNFGNEMVIIAAAGSKPTSGFFITIDAATANRRAATIYVRTITPGANCVALTVVTQPVEAVSVPSRDEVTFVETSETRSCTP